jgi:hypothetical protein
LISLAIGICVPLLAFWMLRPSLAHFLQAVFRDRLVEGFWMRIVLLVLFMGAFSTAVGFRPDPSMNNDFVVLIWNLADQVQAILLMLLYSILGLFLPLLLSYTVLHVGRDRSERGPEA